MTEDTFQAQLRRVEPETAEAVAELVHSFTDALRAAGLADAFAAFELLSLHDIDDSGHAFLDGGIGTDGRVLVHVSSRGEGLSTSVDLTDAEHAISVVKRQVALLQSAAGAIAQVFAPVLARVKTQSGLALPIEVCVTGTDFYIDAE